MTEGSGLPPRADSTLRQYRPIRVMHLWSLPVTIEVESQAKSVNYKSRARVLYSQLHSHVLRASQCIVQCLFFFFLLISSFFSYRVVIFQNLRTFWFLQNQMSVFCRFADRCVLLWKNRVLLRILEERILLLDTIFTIFCGAQSSCKFLGRLPATFLTEFKFICFNF